jgi:acyl carrier protein
MYGITETTVHATYRRIRKSDLDSGARCMIGGPIADLRLYVLDEQRTPVPPGTVGEIYVGGAGVARCYLNRPELTAGRFLPDPFSNTPNARMYRSGDMACWLSAGDLEYRGRIDEQVKVRGFRIELREVEAALRKTPGIGDAAAGTIEDGEGNRILVAWYTNALGSTATSAKEIRGALATAVPEHLVPSRFVRVERIPRTVNGKVDRGALPAPGRQRPDLGGPMVAPGSRAERWLAAHWCDVLNLDEVGVDDPFFELGGTSLAAMRLLGTVSRELGRAISPLLFFQSPTVAALARRLSNDHPEALAAALGKAPVATDSAVRDGPARERDELRARRMRRRNVG